MSITIPPLKLMDYFGVAVFALSGVLAAGRKHLDWFGVLVIDRTGDPSKKVSRKPLKNCLEQGEGKEHGAQKPRHDREVRRG